MTIAVPEPQPTREIARVDVDSWIPVVSDYINLANVIMGTDFVPEALRDSGPATAAALLYGREVGLAPMTALNMVDVVKGHPSLNAEAMRMLVYAAGHEIEFVDTTGARCEVRGRRSGRDKWQTVVWTIDDARQAGLTNGDNWKKYPRRMLQARASSELCKLVFPDVVHGFTSTEEASDDLDAPAGDTPATPGTKVTRARKTAAKKTTPAPLEERGERPAIAGPPLPGEEGYEQASASPGEQDTASRPVAPVEGADAETSEGEAESRGGDSPEEESTAPAVTGAVADEPPGEGGGEAPEPGGSDAPKPPRPRAMTRLQQRGIEAALTDIGVDNDRDERHLIASTILGRHVETFKSLTSVEASKLIDELAPVKDKEQLTALLDEYDAAAKREIARWNRGDRS